MPDLKLQYQMKDDIQVSECTINTSLSQRGNGLHIIVYYPCWWEEQTISYEKNPTLIKQYMGQVGNTFTGVAVDVTPLSNSMTTEQLTEDFFKKRLDTKEEFISYRIVSFGKVMGVEIITLKPVAEGWYLYYIAYESIYENKLISITYSVGADNRNDAQEVFEARKYSISELAERTEFLNSHN